MVAENRDAAILRVVYFNPPISGQYFNFLCTTVWALAFSGFFMWPPNLNTAQHMQHPHGVSLLSLGTHWEFHWPSAFVVDHSDEVVAFEAHDSEFVAAELRRPLRPLEPRPLSSSGLRMKTGTPPEKQQLRRPPLGGPPLFGNLKVNIGGIFYTQTLEVQLASFFYGLVSGTSIFFKVKFYHRPKRTT